MDVEPGHARIQRTDPVPHVVSVFHRQNLLLRKNVRIERHTDTPRTWLNCFAFLILALFPCVFFLLSDANYDGVPSFANFPTFAGWTRPAMKQFAGDVGLCGANVDLNWYP